MAIKKNECPASCPRNFLVVLCILYLFFFYEFSLELLAVFFSLISIFFGAAKERENSRKDEGTAGIGPQHKQGNNSCHISGMSLYACQDLRV